MLVVLTGCLTAAVSQAVTIPLASPRQITASPLERGEVARVERDGAYAELYVGGQNGPLRVADGSALRGYRVRTLDPSEYSVSAGSAWTLDAENNTYTMTQAGPTNSIMVATKDGVVIEGVKVTSHLTGEGLIPGELVRDYEEYKGNTFLWEVAFARATSLVVTKIEVSVREIGEIDWQNDTEEVKFMIKDALGLYDLFDLRKYLLHYYDENRGEDWSAYKAYKPVRLNGNAIRFTDDNRFTMSMTEQTNLVLQAAFRDTIEVNVRTNAPIEYTTFSITNINVGSANQGGPITVGFITDIAGFSADNIGVKVCDGLEDNVWLGLASSDFTISNVSTSGGFTTGTVTIINGNKNGRRFFRLMYGSAMSDTVDIVLHGRVIVKDMLIIKGTDSKFYRIDVNGGTISATELSL